MEEVLKTEVQKLGELRVDNIIEIQYLLKLIHESDLDPTQKQSTGLCLQTLISLTNKYLKENADINKLKETFVEVSESSSEEGSITGEENPNLIYDDDPHN